MSRRLMTLLIVASIPTGNAYAQYHTQRGSVLGGLAGAAAGVAIGEHNDKPVAGALIGGAVGLMTGAALGNTRDRQAADVRAYQYHQQRQFQYQHQQQLSRAVTPEEIIGMSRSGLGDSVIINHIQANGVLNELQVADVITLHKNGVSEPVISAMQRSRGPAIGSSVVTTPVVTTPVYRAPAPVIVEEYHAPRYHYPAPRVYHDPPYRHYHGHGYRGYRASPGNGIHFSYSR